MDTHMLMEWILTIKYIIYMKYGISTLVLTVISCISVHYMITSDTTYLVLESAL